MSAESNPPLMEKGHSDSHRSVQTPVKNPHIVEENHPHRTIRLNRFAEKSPHNCVVTTRLADRSRSHPVQIPGEGLALLGHGLTLRRFDTPDNRAGRFPACVGIDH